LHGRVSDFQELWAALMVGWTLSCCSIFRAAGYADPGTLYRSAPFPHTPTCMQPVHFEANLWIALVRNMSMRPGTMGRSVSARRSLELNNKGDYPFIQPSRKAIQRQRASDTPTVARFRTPDILSQCNDPHSGVDDCFECL